MSVTESGDKKIILEADKRLSQSMIWEIQRQYFLESGIRAWQNNVVPHDISCNPYMARAYADVIIGYLRDILADPQSIDLAEPIYIVELGAGSGRLTHHLLHQLLPKVGDLPFDCPELIFVLTDFAPETIDFWKNQPKLKRLVAAGQLDFAHFDATSPQPLTLINRGITLSPTETANPIILIANYFFDSIPQDSFVIEDGELMENRVSISATRPVEDWADPSIWEQIELDFEPIPLQGPPYRDDLLNEILVEYEAYLPDTVFGFPNVGLETVRFWLGDGDRRGLLLTSDRGHSTADALIGQGDPQPNLHGSFSLMVNYHAIDRYTAFNQGLCLAADHYQDNIQVLGFVFGPLPQAGQEVKAAYQRSVAESGPDDYFGLKRTIRNGITIDSLADCLSLIRLSAGDADLFVLLGDQFLTRLAEADEVWYPDVLQLFREVWRPYLPLGEADALPSLLEKGLAIMDIVEGLSILE